MFSRKQTMQTAPLDLNAVIENLVKLLDRVLGRELVPQDHPRHGGQSPDRARGDVGEGFSIACPSTDHEIAHRSPTRLVAATCRAAWP